MQRNVGRWLLFMAAAVFLQVGLGGITRLTDSGLSITEWKPLLGVVPPHDDAGWNEAFVKYQQLPQYVQLKSHLVLEDFKFIYFWEWVHRLWGRLLGLFFAVPWLVFWRRGALQGLQVRLAVLFVLGGLQGVLGWFMVMSGLDQLLYVSHLRLAAHYLLAVALFAALLWEGARLTWPERLVDERTGRHFGVGFLVALVVQLAWGAFMAGLKAVLFAATWPTINGEWVPSTVGTAAPWNEPLTVHLIHRTLGYALAVAGLGWWWRLRARTEWERHAVAGLVLLQVVLGVLTVVHAPFASRLVALGLSHQLVGTALLGAVVLAVRVFTPARLASP